MKSHCFRLSLTGTADTWWAGNYHRHWKLGFVWRPEIEPYRLPSRKSAIRIKDHTLPYNNFWRRSLPSTYRSVWMDAAGAWTIFSPNDCGEPWSMKIFFWSPTAHSPKRKPDWLNTSYSTTTSARISPWNTEHRRSCTVSHRCKDQNSFIHLSTVGS